ncbi:MAG TPA: DNA methyltransferase [Candidatus Atribacteria bacterium]|nr:DNA methyltransferase [Candidatus Atribacteria bacterium]
MSEETKDIKNSKDKQTALFENLESATFTYGTVIFNKERLISLLDGINGQNSPSLLKNKIIALKEIINSPKRDSEGLLNIDPSGDTVSLRRDILTSELDQILEARTFERAKYYLKRLKMGIQKVKTSKINDINLHRWKEYDEIITDSLWVLDKRDNSGAHIAWYWGNFIPQIPHQMMLRYTKKGDWVLDTFVGSGTTLIECKRLGRNGIGIELNQEVAQKAKELIDKECNRYKVTTEVITGDSRTINIKEVLEKHKINQVQLLIMHPPYHDIIKFSKYEKDLSNARNTKEFLKMFGRVVDNATPFLEKGRYFALVIGDKYSKGEWIPLGFYCMNEVLKRGYLLKSIIVKNFEETRGKRNQKELWRYRALVGGFYIFKHEYIVLFKKK